MSTTDEPDRPPPEEPETIEPKRARLLIAGVVLGGVVLVLAVMLLVGQCASRDDSQIYGAASHGSPSVGWSSSQAG